MCELFNKNYIFMLKYFFKQHTKKIVFKKFSDFVKITALDIT